MFRFGESDKLTSKCYISCGSLPGFIDEKQPPTKRKPFSTLLAQPFNHTVDLILPAEVYDLLWHKLSDRIPHVRYSRCIFSLSAIIEGDFFNHYIKTGNVVLLSEGRPGLDNVFSFREGILRLELSKESYERAGLVGKPIRDGGRKHSKNRYVVELNLRLPSMLHGKKGFERIVWAFKNVLNHSISWLFCDLNSIYDTQEEATIQPLAKYYPLRKVCSPSITRLGPSVIPPMFALGSEGTPSKHHFNQDQAVDLQEWLAMVALESPRIRVDDSIDHHLSRYEVPAGTDVQPSRLVRLRWHGFITSRWVLGVWLQCLHVVRKTTTTTDWFALCIHAFSDSPLEAGRIRTILRVREATPSDPPEHEPSPKLKTSVQAHDTYLALETAISQT